MSDSANNPVSQHLQRFLNTRQPPKTFCPSEVARALSSEDLESEGVKEWRELMPRIRELAWEMRARGEVEVLQKGAVLEQETSLEGIKGPIRLRRAG